MINAKPHRNGNTPDSFMEIGRELYASTSDLKAALVKVRSDITHGRNYQHTRSKTKRNVDLAKVNHLIEACIIAEQLGIDIFKAGEAA